MNLTLLVLAAGMGSRYGGLKQLDAIGPNGEAILDYSVYDAIRAGFTRVVFVIRREFEQDFRDSLGARFQKRIAVDYAFQSVNGLPPGFPAPAGRERPWGTGHAVLSAKDVVKTPFVVINADDFYGQDSFQRVVQHLRAPVVNDGREHFCMVGYELRNTLSDYGTVSRGLCHCNGDGHLHSVREITGIRKTESGAEYDNGGSEVCPLTGRELVSLNLWGFKPALFGHLERQFSQFLRLHGQSPKAEFYIPFAIDSLIQEGSAVVDVLSTTGSWFGVTYREDKPRVEASIRALSESGEYPAKLWD